MMTTTATPGGQGQPRLSVEELARLLERVFAPAASEREVAVLVDLPDGQRPDTAAWRARRDLAADWVRALNARQADLGFVASLYLYRNVRTNNAELPLDACRWDASRALPASADELRGAPRVTLAQVFAETPLLLAPTELSATAPLKIAARQHGFRAATMPGFSTAMIPALRLDYVEVNRRVELLKAHLDQASAAELVFDVEGIARSTHRLQLDLRYRTAHASGGLLRGPGTAGNLPSGEAYIVPYEGEISGSPSASQGELPVQFGDEVVVYQVRDNRAVATVGEGPGARAEQRYLEQEPAYGNIAELGLGVLADFGLEPTGEVLLDEKLGLHLAFGRSEHFGGQVGPAEFSSPEAVVHIDRVYLPSTQPLVRVRILDLIEQTEQRRLRVIANGRYVIPELLAGTSSDR